MSWACWSGLPTVIWPLTPEPSPSVSRRGNPGRNPGRDAARVGSRREESRSRKRGWIRTRREIQRRGSREKLRGKSEEFWAAVKRRVFQRAVPGFSLSRREISGL